MLECGPGEPYVVELFDKRAERVQGILTGLPPSLGKFFVTKEMMECMHEDQIQIHFEYGKR